MRRTPSPHNRVGKFESAFDRFDESCLQQPAACINRRAFGLIDESMGRPFFLYLHYLDPHSPYRPPRERPIRFAEEFRGNAAIAAGNPNPLERWRYGQGPKPGDVGSAVAHLIDRYDEEIAYFDQQFRELLDGLERRGLHEETLIVFASDHGEAFLEDGEVKHCHGIGETQTRTPLVLRIPGVEGGRRIRGAVQNLDVVPTVLDFLGVPVPAEVSQRFEGRSLRSDIEAAVRGTAGDGLAFASWRSDARLTHDDEVPEASGGRRARCPRRWGPRKLLW